MSLRDLVETVETDESEGENVITIVRGDKTETIRGPKTVGEILKELGPTPAGVMYILTDERANKLDNDETLVSGTYFLVPFAADGSN